MPSRDREPGRPAAGDRAPTSRRARAAVALVAAAALVLAGCTDYKVRLGEPTLTETAPGAAGVGPPRPAKEKRSLWGPEKLTGWVRLRFDVSATGQVGNVEVLESSDQRLEAQAAASLSSWPFEPATRDGEPAAVEGAEAVMTFYTDDTTTTGEVIGYTLLIIVLVPVAVVLGAASNGGMSWGK